MTVAEIELCPEDQPEKPSAEIEVCPPEPAKVDFEIEVCPEEEPAEQPDLPNPCDSAPALSISGTETPIVGSDYNYSGGLGPYVWSFDGGEISSAGMITSIDACGDPGDPRWSTVRITDNCGTVAEIEIRLPDGEWKFVESSSLGYSGNIPCENQGTPQPCYSLLSGPTCGDDDPVPYANCTTVSGGLKSKYTYAWIRTELCDDWEDCYAEPQGCVPTAGCTTGNIDWTPRAISLRIDEWQC